MLEPEQAQAAAERKLLNDTIDAVMQDAQTVESAEQAQAIAEIRENQRHRIGTWESLGMCNAMRSEIQQCLKIVDSQAQKSEKLLAENNVLSILVDELKSDIEDQANGIEGLEKQWSESNVQDSFESYASAIGIDIRRRVENHTEMNYLDDVCDVAWAAYLAAAKEFGNIK